MPQQSQPTLHTISCIRCRILPAQVNNEGYKHPQASEEPVTHTALCADASSRYSQHHQRCRGKANASRTRPTRMHLATLRRLSSAPSVDQIVLPVLFFAGFLSVLGLELAQRLQGVPGRVQSSTGPGSARQRFPQQDATWPPRPFHRPLSYPC